MMQAIDASEVKGAALSAFAEVGRSFLLLWLRALRLKALTKNSDGFASLASSPSP